MKRLTRRDFLKAGGATAGVGALGLSLAGTASGQTNRPGRPSRLPNVILVVADDLGYGEVGYNGQRLISTPTLDRLAGEGVRFTGCYAGSPVCAPARCSLMTGMHGGHTRVRENPATGRYARSLTDEDVTIAEVMAAAGYRTGLFGKWHLSAPDKNNEDGPGHPNRRGFEEYWFTEDYFPDQIIHNLDSIPVPDNAGGRRVVFGPERVTDEAVRYVSSEDERPLFMVFTPKLPHAPQQVPDTGRYADLPWSEGSKIHAQQITLLDSYVGRLLDALRDRGIADDTVLIVTSDNGPHEEGQPSFDPELFDGNGELRGYKRNVYEGGIRVPTLAWGPGVLNQRAGTVESRPWFLADVLPTLAAATRAPAPPDLDGLVRRSILFGDDVADPGGDLFWYHYDGIVTPRANAAADGRGDRAAQALRRGKWKAVRYAPGDDPAAPVEQWDVELYDLKTDPAEERDLAQQYPRRASSMTEAMGAAFRIGPYPRDPFSPNGVLAKAPATVAPGEPARVTVEFTNHGPGPASGLALDLAVPPGWTVSAGPAAPSRVASRSSVSRTFTVIPPDDLEAGTYRLTARADYERRRDRITAARDVHVSAAAPGAVQGVQAARGSS